MPAFGPENLAIDSVWAGDITYVRTWEGWAYLATVIDLASRRVVGWALADHMESSCARPCAWPSATVGQARGSCTIPITSRFGLSRGFEAGLVKRGWSAGSSA